MNAATQVYEVKVAGKWSKVRATSMITLNTWATLNGVKQWRLCGMRSIAELAEDASLVVVA